MFRRVALVFISTVSVSLLAGCTTTENSVVDTRDFVQVAAKPEISQAAVLAAGDTIEISVEVDANMEVSRYRVDINYLGFVTLPLVGDVKVGGVTLETARSIIAQRYGVYYVTKPVIMISRSDDNVASEWGQVTVLGRVTRPGVVPLNSSSGINLSAAIQTAGGFASSAKTTDIRVTRIDAHGQKVQVSVNFNEIGESGNAEADLKLMDGDIVYIPERIF